MFISHWGTVGSPNLVPEKVLDNSLLPDYKAWQDTLVKYRYISVNNIANDYSFHLANEQGLTYNDKKKSENPHLPAFTHNNGISVGKTEKSNFFEFPLVTLSKFKSENNYSNSYSGSGDFVTTFMLNNSPDYIKNNYKYFYWTGTSKFMEKELNIKIE